MLCGTEGRKGTESGNYGWEVAHCGDGAARCTIGVCGWFAPLGKLWNPLPEGWFWNAAASLTIGLQVGSVEMFDVNRSGHSQTVQSKPPSRSDAKIPSTSLDPVA